MALSNVLDSPVRLNALDIARSSDAAVRYVNDFFAIFGEAIDDLRATSAFRRLDGISQLGLKRGTRGVPATMVPFCEGRESDTTALGPFARTRHSERVAATMVAFCATHDVSVVDALHAAVAALFHDLGHTAFSHTVEPVLSRRGFPDHEEAGRWIIRGDAQIQAAFEKHGIGTERVVAIVREEGSLGLRQKLCDTCAYLVHDSVLSGFPIDETFARDVLSSVRAVEDGAFVTDDPSVLMRFLERRVQMTADLYEHPFNRLNSLFVCQIVEWLVDAGYLEAEALGRLIDPDVLAALTVALDDGAPTWVVFAADFISRDPLAIRHWNISEHASESSAIESAAPATADRPRFLLPPVDFTGKTLPVRPIDGIVFHLRVPSDSRPYHHKLWYVVSYAGPV